MPPKTPNSKLLNFEIQLNLIQIQMVYILTDIYTIFEFEESSVWSALLNLPKAEGRIAP